MERGSLKEYLSDPLKTPLNWQTRLKIAIGIAAVVKFVVYGLLVGLLLRKAADDLVENQKAFFVKVIHMREKCASVKMLKEAENNKATETRASRLPEAVCLLLFGYS